MAQGGVHSGQGEGEEDHPRHKVSEDTDQDLCLTIDNAGKVVVFIISLKQAQFTC